MPSDASYAHGRTTRRTALGAAGWVTGVVGLATLSGCGIRVGQPEPSRTTPPARQPVADEAELLTALGDAVRLAGDVEATAPQSGVTRLLAAVHAEHAVALRAVLRAAGVPDPVVASSLSAPSTGPSVSSMATADATSTTAPSRLPVSPEQLAVAEGAAVTAPAISRLGGTTSAHRPVLSAVATRRAVAVTALGGTLTWPPTDPLPSAAAAALLTSTRAVVYGLEVVAARLPEPERAQALVTLAALRQREAGLTSLAGDAAPPVPLGYDLPSRWPRRRTPDAWPRRSSPASSRAASTRSRPCPEGPPRSEPLCGSRPRPWPSARRGGGAAVPPGDGLPVTDLGPLIPDDYAARIASATPGDLESGRAYAVTGADWLRRLPRLLDDLLDTWGLTPAGPSRSGVCAVAVPVTSADGPAVLKVTWPHAEALTEHLALRAWAGRGAVRLLRADPSRFALLLEQLDPTDLLGVEIDDACRVIGELLAQLSSPALPQVPLLSAYAVRQQRALASEGLPRRFVDQARRLAGELAADPTIDARLLHTDLHYANVLRSTRQPWLAIDPKPMAGDPAFDVAPALWNRGDELGTGSSVRWLLRRRLEVICEAAGIDEDRAKAWTIVRVVDNARDGLPSDISRAVAVLKAMND